MWGYPPGQEPEPTHSMSSLLLLSPIIYHILVYSFVIDVLAWVLDDMVSCLPIAHRAIQASGWMDCGEWRTMRFFSDIFYRNRKDLSFCDHVPCGWLFDRLISLVVPLESARCADYARAAPDWIDGRDNSHARLPICTYRIILSPITLSLFFRQLKLLSFWRALIWLSNPLLSSNSWGLKIFSKG